MSEGANGQMHQQIRCVPKASPPDVERFLRVLKEADVNLLAVGGGGLELGGEIAIAPEDGQAQRAMDALAEYQPRLLEAENGDYKLCWVTHASGALHDCIAEAAAENLESGKVIQDILVGVERDEQNRVPIQIYSVEIKREQAGRAES